MAYEKAMPRIVYSRARHHPGARNAMGISGETSLVRHLREVLDQGIHLLSGQRIAEVRGHDVGLETGRDHLVGVEDRLLDEGRVLALEDLVEVWPDLALGARVGQRVARGTGRRPGVGVAVREDLLGVHRRAAAATTAASAGRGLGRHLLHPLVEGGWG